MIIKKQYSGIIKEAIKNIPGGPASFQFLSGLPAPVPFFLITFYLRGQGYFIKGGMINYEND